MIISFVPILLGRKQHDELSPACWCEPKVEWVEFDDGTVDYALIAHRDEDGEAQGWEYVTSQDDDLRVGHA